MSEMERCTYILPKKKRKCKMLVKKGKRFCGEHAIYDPDDQDRVPCPNDPKHTVNREELEEHLLKRCNARLPDEPWIVKDLNLVADPVEDDMDCETDFEKRRFEEELLINIREKIGNALAKLSHEICDQQLSTEKVDEYIKEAKELGASHRKHLLQHSSIIGHMMKAKLLKDEQTLCVVDLGSGKAELPYWMTKVAPKCQFLLIDRQGMRNKYDNKATRENPEVRMDRLRCSIEHLDLSKVRSIKDAKDVVAVCKHFCGRATDWGIRCLENACAGGLQLSGFALAPCCHHKSSYSEYVGKAFLKQYGIASMTDFAALRYLASWAVCGMRKHEKQEPHGEVVNTSTNVEVPERTEPSQRSPESSASPSNETIWSREEKEKIGRQAKILLELGRAAHLKQLGFNVSVYQYVDFSVSPENLLIVGRKDDC